MNKNVYCFFLMYFSICCFIGFYVRDISGQPDFFEDVNHFISNYNKFGDPLSFANGALDIYTYSWFSSGNSWLIHLWPTGFMLLEGLILKIFGINAPFILILIILNSLFTTCFLTMLQLYLSQALPKIVAVFSSLFILIFPLTRLWLL